MGFDEGLGDAGGGELPPDPTLLMRRRSRTSDTGTAASAGGRGCHLGGDTRLIHVDGLRGEGELHARRGDRLPEVRALFGCDQLMIHPSIDSEPNDD